MNEKKGIAYEVKRGEGLSCVVCKKRGATVGCTLADCERSYHIQCAANVGAKFDVVRHVLGEGGLFCEKHISHPDAASASSAGPGCNISMWADESRNCRKGRDRASELENANDTTVLADELIKKRRKMMDLAMSISGAMGKRCGVCNCGFRVVEGRFSHGPPAANARHTNPLSRDPAHLASSLFLNEESVAELANWHPLAGGVGRADPSDRSSAPAGFGPDLKDENDELSDEDNDDESEDSDEEEEEKKKRRKLELRRKAILRSANITTDHSSSLLSSTLDSNRRQQIPDLNFDEDFSGADILEVNSVPAGDFVPSLYLQGRGREEPGRQLRRRSATDSASASLSILRPVKEACASPDDAGRADDGSWWLAGAPLSCTDCGILVHAACYGISFSIAEQLLSSYLSTSSAASSVEGRGGGGGEGVLSWACDSCRFIEKEKPSSPIMKCILCPVVNTSSGENKASIKSESSNTLPVPIVLPLKRCTVIKAVQNNNKLAFPHVSLKSSIKGKWVHLSCALWHTEESSQKSTMTEEDEEMEGGVIIVGGKKGDKKTALLTDLSSRVSVSIGDLSKLSGIVVTVSDQGAADGISESSASASSLSATSNSDGASLVTVISKFPCVICQSSVGATIPLAVRGTGRGSDSRSYVHASCAVQAMWHTELWAPVPPPPVITASTKRRSEKNVAAKTDVELSLSFPLSLSVPALTVVRDGGVAVFHPSSSPVAAFCVCREPDDGSLMVECDVCRNWFHARCVGVNPKRVKTNEDGEAEDGQMLGELEDAFACSSCFSKGGVPDKAIIAANLLNAEMSNLPPRPFSANQLIPPSIVFGSKVRDTDNDSDLGDSDDSDSTKALELDEEEIDGKNPKAVLKKSKSKKNSGKSLVESGSSKQSGSSFSSSDALVKLQLRGGNSKGNDLLTFLTPFNLYHVRTWGRACEMLLSQARDASGASSSSKCSRPTAHSALSLLVGFHSIYVPFSIASRSRSSTIAYLLQIASSPTPKSHEIEIVLDRLFKILMQTSLYDNLLAIGTRVRHTKEFCYGYIDNLITVMVEEKGHDTHEICQYMVRFDGDREARQTRCDLVERVKGGSFAETDSSNTAQHKSHLNLLMQRNAYYFPPSTVDGCRAITSAGVRFLLEELDNCANYAQALIIALPQSPVVGALLPLELMLSAHAKFLSIASKALDSAEEHIISISLRNAGVIDESVLYTVSNAKGYHAALILVDAILTNEKKLPLSAPSTLMSRALSMKALINWLQAVELLTPFKGASDGIESSQGSEEEITDVAGEATNSLSGAILKTSLLETSKVVASYNAATESEINAWGKYNAKAGDLHQILSLFADATRPGLIRSALCDLSMRYGVSVESGLLEVDDSHEIQGFFDIEDKTASDDLDLVNIDSILGNDGGDMFYKAKKVIGQQRVWPPGSITFKRLFSEKQTDLSPSSTSLRKKTRSATELPDDEDTGPTTAASLVDANGRRLTSRRAALEASAAEKAAKRVLSSSSSSSASKRQDNTKVYAALPELGFAPREWSFFTLPIGGVKTDIPRVSRSSCVSVVLSNLHRHPLRSVSLLCRFARAANSWLKTAKRIVPKLSSRTCELSNNGLELEMEEEEEADDGVDDGENESTRQLTKAGINSSSHYYPSLSVPPASPSMLMQLSKVARAWHLTSPRLITAEGLLIISKRWDINAKLAINRAETASPSSSMIPLAELLSLCTLGKKLPVLLKMKKKAFEIADRLSWHDRASKAVSSSKSGGDKRPKIKIIVALLLQSEDSNSSADASHFDADLVSQLKQLEKTARIAAIDNQQQSFHALSDEATKSIESFLEATGGSEARIQESTALKSKLLHVIDLIESNVKLESSVISHRLKTFQSLPLVTSEEEDILERMEVLKWSSNIVMSKLKASLIEYSNDRTGQDTFFDLVCAGLGSNEKLQEDSLQYALSALQQRKQQKKSLSTRNPSYIPEVFKNANQLLGSTEPTDTMISALNLILHNSSDDEAVGMADDDEFNLEELQTQSSVAIQVDQLSSSPSSPIIATAAALIFTRFLALALAWRKSTGLLHRRVLLATSSSPSMKLLKPDEFLSHRSFLQTFLNSVVPVPLSTIYASFNDLCAKLDGLLRSVTTMLNKSERLYALEIQSKDLFTLFEKDASSQCFKILADFSSAGFQPTLALVSFQKGLIPVLSLVEATKKIEDLLCLDESLDEDVRCVELRERAHQVIQHRNEIVSLLSAAGEKIDSGFWTSLVFSLERYAKTLCVSSQLFTTYAHALSEEKSNTLSQNGFFSSPYSEESMWNIPTESLLSAVKLATLRGGGSDFTSSFTSASSVCAKNSVRDVLKADSSMSEGDERRIVNGFTEVDVKNASLKMANDQRRIHLEKLLHQTESYGLDQIHKQLLDLSSTHSLVTLLGKIQEASTFPIQSPFLVSASAILIDKILAKRAKDLAIQLDAALKSGNSNSHDVVMVVDEKVEAIKMLDLASLENVEKSCATLISFSKKNEMEDDAAIDHSSYVASDALQTAHADLKTALNVISEWRQEAELLLSSTCLLTNVSTSTPEKLLQSPLLKVISIPLAVRLSTAHRETLQWTQRAEKVLPIALTAINAAMKAVLPASLSHQQNSSSSSSSSTIKGQLSFSGSNSDSTFSASLSAEQKLRGVSKELAILALQARKYLSPASLGSSSKSESIIESSIGASPADQISSFSRASLWWLAATASVGNVSPDNEISSESSAAIDSMPNSLISAQPRRHPFLQLPPSSSLFDSIILTLRQSDGVLNLRHALGLSAPEEIQTSATASYFLSLREILRPRVTLTILLELISKMQSLGFGGIDGQPVLIQSALSAVNAANYFASRVFTGLSGTDEPALSLLNTYLANHANPGQESHQSFAATTSTSLLAPSSQPLSQTLYAPQVTCDNVIDFLEAQVVYSDHKASKTGPWSYLSIAGIDNAVDEFDKSSGRSALIDSVHPSRDSTPKASAAESISGAGDASVEAAILSRITRRKRIKWAKIRGFPFWPASLVPSSLILSMSPPLGGEAVLQQKQTKPNNFVMVKFFGSHPALSSDFLLASTGMAPASIGGSTNFAWIRRSLVRPWGRGPNSQDCPNLQPIFVPDFFEAVRQAVSAVEDIFSEISVVSSVPLNVQPQTMNLEHNDINLDMMIDRSTSAAISSTQPAEPKLSDFAHLPASIRVMAFVKAKSVYSKRGNYTLSSASSSLTLETSVALQKSMSKQSNLVLTDANSSTVFPPMSLCLGMTPTTLTREFVTKIRTQVEEEIKKALLNTLRGATVSNIESILISSGLNMSGPLLSNAVISSARESVLWATDLISRRSSEIEASLYARYLFGSEAVKQQEYGQKFRDIVAVLRLSEIKDNIPTGSASFRKKVIAGVIRPFQLARMSASELASELKSCASIDKKDAENEKQKSGSINSLTITAGKSTTTTASVSATASGQNPPGRTLTSLSSGIESTVPKSSTSLLFKAAGISKPTQKSLNSSSLAPGAISGARALHKRSDIPSEDLDDVELAVKKQKVAAESTAVTSSTPLLTTSSLSEYLAQARAKAASAESDNDGSDKEKDLDKDPSQQVTERGSHFDIRMPPSSYTFSASFNAPPSIGAQKDNLSESIAQDLRRQKRSLPSSTSSLPSSSVTPSSAPVPLKKPRIDGSDNLKMSQELIPYAGIHHIFELNGVYKRAAPNPEGKLDNVMVSAVRCSFIASPGEAGWTERLRECPPNSLMQQASPLIFSPAKLVGRMQVDASEKGFLTHLSSIDVGHARVDPPEKRAMCAFKISCDNESFREFLQSLATDSRVGVVRLDKERDDSIKCYLYIIPPLSYFTSIPTDLVRAMSGEGKAGFLGSQMGVRNEHERESAFAILEYRPDNYPSKFTQKRGERVDAAPLSKAVELPSQVNPSDVLLYQIPQSTFNVAPPTLPVQVVPTQAQDISQPVNVVSSEVATAIAQVNRFPTPYMDASTLHFFNEAVSKCREPAAPMCAVTVMQGQMKGNPSHMLNYAFLLPESPLYAYFLARVGGGGYYLDEIGIKALSGAPAPAPQTSASDASTTSIVKPTVPALLSVDIQSLLQRATKPAITQVEPAQPPTQSSFSLPAAAPAQLASAPPPVTILPSQLPALGGGGRGVDRTRPAWLSAATNPIAPYSQPNPPLPPVPTIPPGPVGSGRGDGRTKPAWMK